MNDRKYIFSGPKYEYFTSFQNNSRNNFNRNSPIDSYYIPHSSFLNKESKIPSNRSTEFF